MRSAFLVNPFGAREQELADPIERIVFAVPVSEGFVLDSPAHRVQAPVPDPHHMKGVGDPQGVVEVWGHAGPVVLGQVGGRHPDRLEPSRVLAAHHRRRSATAFPSTMSMSIRRSRSTSSLT